MRLSSRIAWYTATNWTASLLAIISALYLVRFLFGELGEDAFGTIVFIETLVNFAMLADMGVRMSVSRHLAERVALEDTEGVNRLYSSAMAVNVVAGAMLVVLGCVSASWMVDYIGVPQAYRSQTIALLQYYVGSTVFLSLVSPTFVGVIEAYGRFDLVNYAHSCEVVSRLFAIIAFVHFMHGGSYGWAWGGLLSKVLYVAMIAWWAYRTCPTLHLSLRYLDRATFRELFSLGAQMVVYRIVTTLNVQMGPIILYRCLGPVAVAIFGPAQKVVLSVQRFVLALTAQLQQLSTSYSALDNREGIRAVLIHGTRYMVLMGVGCSIVFAVFAQAIITVWIGRDLTAAQVTIAATTLVICTISELCHYVGGPQPQIMLGMNRFRYIISVQSVFAVLNLIASILVMVWAVQRGWGLNAVPLVAVPSAIAAILQRLMITRHVAAQVGIGLGEYFRLAYFRPLLVLLLLTAFSLMLEWTFTPRTLPSLLGCTAASGTAWLLLCWFVAFDDGDKQRFQNMASKLLQRIFPREASAGGE